jgi:hypothetical protein
VWVYRSTDAVGTAVRAHSEAFRTQQESTIETSELVTVPLPFATWIGLVVIVEFPLFGLDDCIRSDGLAVSDG